MTPDDDSAPWALVVDDDPLVARVVARTLQRHAGLRVRCAHDPDEAEGVLRQEPPPRAVLLDYNLGPSSSDGVALLAKLRERGLRAPVAFCSATPPKTVAARLRAEGLEPVPCFTKPVPPAILARWLGPPGG